MALNMCETWSNGIKIAFFPKTNKNRPAAGGFALRPYSHRRLGFEFEYTRLLNTSPKLDICTF